MSESPVNPPVEEQRDPILMEILSAIQSLTARVRTLEGPGSNVDTSGEPQPEEAALPAGRNPGAIPVREQKVGPVYTELCRYQQQDLAVANREKSQPKIVPLT